MKALKIKKKQHFFKFTHFRSGFTLVELLISVFIILSVGSMVVVIYFASLSGSNKSDTITAAQQNGSFAINQMSRTIRNAKTFVGVRSENSDFFTNNCTVEPQEPYKYAQVIDFSDQTITLACPVGNEKAILSNGFPLIDVDKVQIESGSCYMTCKQNSSSEAPIVGIHFIVKSANDAGAVDRSVSIPFETTVIPRNFAR